MRSPKELLEEAEAAERLASVVSYRPDREKLLASAQRLRREAQEAEARQTPGGGGPAAPPAAAAGRLDDG